MAVLETLQDLDDVEIRIFREYESGYLAEIELADGTRGSTRLQRLPENELRSASDPESYGRLLSGWLFLNEVAEVFAYAQKLARDPSRGRTGLRLRFRLSLDPELPELSRLGWECLHDPHQDQPLSLVAAFSRYVRVSTPRSGPVWDRPLRMLVIASSPEELERSNLMGADEELEKQLEGMARPLGGLLQLHHLSGSPSLATVRASLKEGYHIVHILAHIVSREGQGYLIMVDEEGRMREESFRAVATAIGAGSIEPPYLVFLETPQAAPKPNSETPMGLAPMLIHAGVQAAVAVQGPIDASRLRRFTNRFYEVLIGTGLIDVSVAHARREIHELGGSGGWEWTYPRLYTRASDVQIFQRLVEA